MSIAEREPPHSPGEGALAAALDLIREELIASGQNIDPHATVKAAEKCLTLAMFALADAYEAFQSPADNLARMLCMNKYNARDIVMLQSAMVANGKACILFPIGPIWLTYLEAARAALAAIEALSGEAPNTGTAIALPPILGRRSAFDVEKFTFESKTEVRGY